MRRGRTLTISTFLFQYIWVHGAHYLISSIEPAQNSSKTNSQDKAQEEDVLWHKICRPSHLSTVVLLSRKSFIMFGKRRTDGRDERTYWAHTNAIINSTQKPGGTSLLSIIITDVNLSGESYFKKLGLAN